MRQVIGHVVVEDGVVRVEPAGEACTPTAASFVPVNCDGLTLEQSVRKFRRRLVEETLLMNSGSIRATASALGMTRRGLQLLMRREALR